MTLDLTFKQVCDLIKKDGKQDSKLIDAVEKLLGLALVCSPVVLGPAAVTALLPLLTTKNEIVKLGKEAFETLTRKKDDDYLGRQERMQMAYGLLVFTAFFDALDSQIPKVLRERIGLLDSEKAFIAKESTRKTMTPAKGLADACECADAPVATIPFSFPHPTESLTQQIERHAVLWGQMGQSFHGFLQKLAVWEKAKEKEQAQLLNAIQKTPEEAGKFFEAQYFELSRQFEDFAVWANLQEHKQTKQLIGELSDYVKQHAYLSKAGGKVIDIGFAKLHAAVIDIPMTLQISQATDLVQSLTKHYRARVNDPIIEDKEEPQEDKPRLSFPRVCDAFIPQSFRVLRQTGMGQRLEDEATWQDLPRRNDLGAFMLSYLSSPYSTESPLLILGHPGSGKSLLTTVLSSQLMSEHFTAIRVPLREVNAEAGIVTQIEEAIRRITNISVDSWAKLSSAFKNSPPLVILDGYDELLQASGKVFAGYLKDVQHFQKNEAEQERPVRVIVTSRVTLIDKAIVPPGATIVRLLEFDESQRERWISIWNTTNVNYFREAKIDEFALPGKRETGSERIFSLAEQPLLLLMLALYDSQGNQLRNSKGLDRTKLYDSLLRRFVSRERGKEKGFDDTKTAEKKKMLDAEMQRLGVAALGMYNRRKVHILAPELNDDLKFFNLERPVMVAAGRPLSQADLLLGSFFFVHKSKAQHTAGAPETHEETSAFEFLHNTFGEFLTADFILRRTLAEVEALQAFQSSEALREDLEKRLNSADGFKREWFASLVYTPLFTRPVILEMMREWINHILKERNLSREDFLANLDTIILNQIKRLLNKREMPSIIRKETAQEGYRAPFGDHPLLGHIAIYSINLILLRVLVCNEPFVFDEGQITTHEDGTRPWDRLAHVWRSWFSLDNLNGVTAMLLADRKDAQVTVRAKKKFQVAESQNRLETCLNVALSLGDDIASGISGLLLFEPSKGNYLDIEDIARRLASEKIDMEFQITMKRLFHCERGINAESALDYAKALHQALDTALRSDKRQELEHICLSLRRVMRKLKLNDGMRKYDLREKLEAFRKVLNSRIVGEIAMRNPQAALLLWNIAREVPDLEWKRAFGLEFFEFSFRRGHPMEMMERDPDIWIPWLQLLREIGWRSMEQHTPNMLYQDFFDRALDPRHLLKLSDQNPEAALAWVQLAREFGGQRFVQKYIEEFRGRTLDFRHFHKLSERNPEAALAWLQLAREFGGKRFVEHLCFGEKIFPPDFFERMLDPGRLLELTERSPQVALAWLKIVREFADKRFLEQYEGMFLQAEYFTHALDPGHLLELSERDATVALIWLQLAREFGGEHFITRFREEFFDTEFFERIFHPRRLRELVERNPEASLNWLEILEKFGTGGFIEKRGQVVFERAFDSGTMVRFLRDKPTAFAVTLRLARILRSSKGIEEIREFISLQTRRPKALMSMIEALPISALTDIEWLAKELNNSEFASIVRHLNERQSRD